MPSNENPRRVDVPRLLTHPLIVLAIALWWLNDHVLKAAFGNALTGKLSDVAGLIAAPSLLLGVMWLLRLRPTLRAATLCAAATGAGLAAINVWGPAAAVYRGAFDLTFAGLSHVCSRVLESPPVFGPAQLTMDPSDLWTLPAVLATPALARRLQRDSRLTSSRDTRTTGRPLRSSRPAQKPVDG